MRGKRASEVGDTMAAFLAIVCVLVVMAIFVYLSFGISVLKKPSNEISRAGFVDEKLLLVSTTFELDNEMREVSLTNVLTLVSRNLIDPVKIPEFLEKVYSEKGKCYYFYYKLEGSNEAEYYYSEDFFSGFKGKLGQRGILLIDGKIVEVESHYDVC